MKSQALSVDNFINYFEDLSLLASRMAVILHRVVTTAFSFRGSKDALHILKRRSFFHLAGVPSSIRRTSAARNGFGLYAVYYKKLCFFV